MIDIKERDDSVSADFTPAAQLSQLEELYISYGKAKQVALSFLSEMYTITTAKTDGRKQAQSKQRENRKKGGKETDMGNRIGRSRRFFMFLIWGIVLCGIGTGSACMTVNAEEQNGIEEQTGTGEQTFILDAKILPSEQSAYVIQLKVENQGPDWEGTVRLMMTELITIGASNNCAYDTHLTLPQGSTKQFEVRIPKDSIDRTDGVVQVTLFAQNGDKVAKQEFGRLLQAEVDSLGMGILSDEYRSLSYLDMGGNEFYLDGRNYPIRLEKLDQDKLADSLDGLIFLVIDCFHTDVLSDQAVESIGQWVDNGGRLIIGTGSSAGEVLAGFDDLEIQCSQIYDPGEGTYSSSDYVDVSQLPMAELVAVSGQYREGYDIFGMVCSRGNGAVEILPYSLAEAAKYNAVGDYEQQNNFVQNVLWQVNNYASSTYGSGQYAYNYDSMYFLTGISRYLGNGSNRLRFGGLKVIVILYVIFVGPILYLILRFTKKRDYYWIGVPAAALVGIILMYWAERGFEVVGTNVYSVTIKNLSDSGDARTYLRCYDAGHKEWALRLAEGYEYAGPMEDRYYSSSEKDYYYRIQKEGERLFFGIDPSVGFEDGYFQAGIAMEPEDGSIHSDLQMNGQHNISGTVTNGTRRDFKYFAVCSGENVFVYRNLPAGAEVALEEAEAVYENKSGYYDGMTGYCYRFLQEAQDGELEKDADILAALGMGVSSAYSLEDPDAMVIVGVIEDWGKAVDDDCSEVSYGCLYAVQ